jgi:5-methylcytosine-specific restriction endonuclease McrA
MHKGVILPSRKGKKLSEWHKKRISDSNLGKPCPEHVKRFLRETRKGKNGSGYIDGRSKIVDLIRDSSKYQEWRQKVFVRDNFTCKECKNIGGMLHAHHIKRFAILIEEVKINLPLMDLYDGAMIYEPFWDLNNGKTLCERCHKKYPTYIKGVKK